LKLALEPASAALARGAIVDRRLGSAHRQNENTTDKWPISRAVETVFQFRGVMGTYSHKHDNGTPILPVFRGPRPDSTPASPAAWTPCSCRRATARARLAVARAPLVPS
jgi:hypothetical protein